MVSIWRKDERMDTVFSVQLTDFIDSEEAYSGVSVRYLVCVSGKKPTTVLRPRTIELQTIG